MGEQEDRLGNTEVGIKLGQIQKWGGCVPH